MGIFLNKSNDVLSEQQLASVTRAADVIAHRGPDESGRWVSPTGRCAMSFRRLSIIDIKDSHQPMSDTAGQVAIVFNGEIYNYKQLRDKLISQSVRFKTHGDTEVLLQLYLQKGREMLDDIKGMFAFAIYDGRDNTLFIARDHLGQKPLYLQKNQNSIAFASEIKSLKEISNCHDSLNFISLSLYLTMGYIPSGKSIYSDITSLPPGSYAVIRAGDMQITPKRYYTPAAIEAPKTYSQAVDLTRELVTESVRSHMVADVPVGVLLSGGVDSAIICAAASKLSSPSNPLRTFTAGFNEAGFDERPVAQTIAQHCNTQHTPLLITPDLENVFYQLTDMYDQPFADSSALATWLVCKHTRKHVKVALGGDGGDEVFGGYDRYRAMHLAQHMSMGTYMSVQIMSTLLKPFAPHNERNRLRRIIRFADGLIHPFAKQYFSYRCLFDTAGLKKLLSADFLANIDVDLCEQEFCDLYEQGDWESEVNRAQNHDTQSYLPDDLLVKTDIASMACGLELRAPLLDPNLVNFGLSLPPEWKISRKRGKTILKDAFSDMLPKEIFNLPKRGFGLPLGDWLAGPLRPQLKSILTHDKVKSSGIFNPNALASLFNEHITKKADHRHRLWALGILGAFLIKRDS